MIRIGNQLVGPGHPTFVIAEMSGNHGGQIETAIEIIRAAKRVGASAVKIQTYTADSITLKSDRDDFRIPSTNPWSQYSSLWDLYHKASTPWDWHDRLFEEARKVGIEIFSSPFDEAAVDLLESLGAPAYKIASPEITHIPLLQRVAKTGKPVILSTGVAEASDIELALSTLRDSGANEIVVLKCTTAYPAPPEESNLRTIPDLASRYQVLSGLSDHSIGTAVPIAAVALGASVIEKHFVLDGSPETVDSFFSSGEAEFAKMVSDIRIVERSLGSVSYEISPSAKSSIRGRRSLYVSAKVGKGEKLTAANIKCVRPSFGLHPKYFEAVLGKRAKMDLQPGDRLSLDLFEE